MRSRSVPPFALLVLGLLGAWAGTSAGQLPPPPSVSLPTVTVPSVPLTPAPPPTPSLPTVPTPPTPAPPRLPVEPAAPPAEVSTPPVPATTPAEQTAPPASSPAAPRPREDGFGASSRFLRIANSTFPPTGPPAAVAPRPAARRETVPARATPSAEAPATRSAVAQAGPRQPAEEAPSGGLASTLETLRSAAVAVPAALFMLALLAVGLLLVAAMPQPLRASWPGAALVHHRGTIAIAGIGVLAVAILTAGLLL